MVASQIPARGNVRMDSTVTSASEECNVWRVMMFVLLASSLQVVRARLQVVVYHVPISLITPVGLGLVLSQTHALFHVQRISTRTMSIRCADLVEVALMDSTGKAVGVQTWVIVWNVPRICLPMQNSLEMVGGKTNAHMPVRMDSFCRLMRQMRSVRNVILDLARWAVGSQAVLVERRALGNADHVRTHLPMQNTLDQAISR